MLEDVDNDKFRNIFKDIMKKDFLQLPLRWDGEDFLLAVRNLFEKYIKLVSKFLDCNETNHIEEICDAIFFCINEYYKGFPNRAFQNMITVMKKLSDYPLTTYSKSGFTDAFQYNDPLVLYRIRNVQQNAIYKRKHIFHTPYNLRTKVFASRYSISGYPSLYLGTSLRLCCEESKISRLNDLTLASRFKLERNMHTNDQIEINVIDLGIKPSDFFMDESANNQKLGDKSRSRHLKDVDLDKCGMMKSYIHWYPLIAACSYIRANKNAPFTPEYIIPQLLMQWVRENAEENKLIGIRYFSCASVKSSELGFNYVFPVSEEDKTTSNYCRILTKVFKLTKPYYIHEYESLESCEEALICDNDLKYI